MIRSTTRLSQIIPVEDIFEVRFLDRAIAKGLQLQEENGASAGKNDLVYSVF